MVFSKNRAVKEEDLSKYDIDTDEDGFPDFIETELGFDPNANDYDRCRVNKCSEVPLATTVPKKKNVLIILDSSSDMATALDGRPKMEITKEAIKNYISKATTNTDIGLLVYGQKGSSSAQDKAVSCGSVEQISALGSVNPQTIDLYLKTIKPAGWAPIGLAIKTASSIFSGKENDENEIIVVSGGAETCESLPAEAAKAVRASPAKVKVNVIGFAVDSDSQAQLRQISTAGEGVFASDNFDNLSNQTVVDQSKCKAEAYTAFVDCYGGANGISSKVISYLGDRIKLYQEKKISQAEFERITKLQDFLFAQRRTQLNQESEQKSSAVLSQPTVQPTP